MTGIQKDYLETAEELLDESEGLNTDSVVIVKRILRDWKRKCEQLECVRRTITTSLPLLDTAFRRYSCANGQCGTKKCPNPWPCQASLIRVVANDLRDCLAIREATDAFKQWDTVFWEDPDEGLCSGDYTVTAVNGDILTLEDDDGSEVEAYASECRHREWRDADFPNWALCYFVNGDGSSLADDEMKQVDAFVDEMRKAGYTTENVTEDRNEFCAHPAFGLATDTTRVRFYKSMKEER